jgi:hypothetical protein
MYLFLSLQIYLVSHCHSVDIFLKKTETGGIVNKYAAYIIGFRIPGMWFRTLPYGVQSKASSGISGQLNKIANNELNKCSIAPNNGV